LSSLNQSLSAVYTRLVAELKTKTVAGDYKKVVVKHLSDAL